jgi:hypothetical protein
LPYTKELPKDSTSLKQKAAAAGPATKLPPKDDAAEKMKDLKVWASASNVGGGERRGWACLGMMDGDEMRWVLYRIEYEEKETGMMRHASVMVIADAVNQTEDVSRRVCMAGKPDEQSWHARR